jgi:hypothetical protein
MPSARSLGNVGSLFRMSVKGPVQIVFYENFGERRDTLGEVFNALSIPNMDNQRVILGTPLGFKIFG